MTYYFILHKFTAFREQLTEEQLKKVYEKYNFYMEKLVTMLLK